ncbi:MAG: sulfite exporter TauE/SafE family protein [Tenacibaculum sp.]
MLSKFATEYQLIVILFFFIALLYASVGFGGGSSYLAVLTLTSLAFTQIRATALLCNIVVVSGNTIMYIKRKDCDFKKNLPLVLFSIPCAFVGGYLKISQTFFYILLGFILLLASISMWFSSNTALTKNKKHFSVYKNAIYGGFIGFISGMAGVGGGIFLAPFLHLTNWDTPKKIAATASLFIWANSISGLIGQGMGWNFKLNLKLALVLLLAVFIGGQIGNRLGNKIFTLLYLKKATAVLIAFASLRILWKCVL